MMNHSLHPNQAGFPLTQSGPDPLEMLQTDVMRFFAIIALCLVAVFALVQSMALVPDDPVLPEHKALKESEQTIKGLRADLQQQQEKILLKNRELQELRQQLLKARARLEQERQTSTREVLDQPAAEREPVQAEPSRREQAVSPAAEPERTPPPQPERPAASPKGFSLFFASDQALEHLIRRDEVGFYAMTRRTSYRVAFASGAPVFKKAVKPGQFHEMAVDTVPEIYRRTFQSEIGTVQAMTWGVTLPEETKRSLQKAMAGRSGGRLAIQADGGVQVVSE